MKNLFFILLVMAVSTVANGQSFSSGSTGADGALDLAAMSCTTCDIQLPESGILNYTTVNIPVGKMLRFKSNLRNTPVIMLAQGTVIIAGSIDVSAVGLTRTPGPGGFHGGSGGGSLLGLPGFGPGGGQPSDDLNLINGKWVGPLSLVPIVGGSGGASTRQCNYPLCVYVDGGGGGGALVIASSSSITLTGSISANGSDPCPSIPYYCWSKTGIGSGGAIRLLANAISISGSLSACGGNCGTVKLEAPTGSVNFSGTSSPPAIISIINPVVVPINSPNLIITSIGGYTVPIYSGTRFDTVDLLLPSQLTDPINVIVQASNITVGTQVKAVFSGSTATFTPGTLQGTLASSTATLTISNLNRSAVTYLFVYVTFDPPMTSLNHNPKGKDRVAKVRLEAKPGANQKFVFLRKDGSEIDTKKLPQAFLQEFGMN